MILQMYKRKFSNIIEEGISFEPFKGRENNTFRNPRTFTAKDGNRYKIATIIDIGDSIGIEVFGPLVTETAGGKSVGRLYLVMDSNGNYFVPPLKSQGLYVDENYRRIGIATAMHDYVNNVLNKKTKMSSVVSQDAIEFWKNRNRKLESANDIFDKWRKSRTLTKKHGKKDYSIKDYSDIKRISSLYRNSDDTIRARIFKRKNDYDVDIFIKDPSVTHGYSVYTYSSESRDYFNSKEEALNWIISKYPDVKPFRLPADAESYTYGWKTFEEKYVSKFVERNLELFNSSEVLKNPDKKQLLTLIQKKPETEMKVLRGILSGADLYVWGEQNLLHEDVMEHMNLPHTSVTIEIDFSGSPVEIRLSTTNDKLNNISKLPAEKQKEIIMENPQIKKLFSSGMQKAVFM